MINSDHTLSFSNPNYAIAICSVYLKSDTSCSATPYGEYFLALDQCIVSGKRGSRYTVSGMRIVIAISHVKLVTTGYCKYVIGIFVQNKHLKPLSSYSLT
jgi:hypothetical protein